MARALGSSAAAFIGWAPHGASVGGVQCASQFSISAILLPAGGSLQSSGGGAATITGLTTGASYDFFTGVVPGTTLVITGSTGYGGLHVVEVP